MSSPYKDLPPTHFWRTGVAEQTPPVIPGLYRKKFAFSGRDTIATSGSCFAQHISKRLIQHNYKVILSEPPPFGMSPEGAQEFGYNIFSGRFGNIYTVRQLYQLILEAYNQRTPKEIVWEKDGRFYDALRPSVEPYGLNSAEEVLIHRKAHLNRFRWMVRETSIFIFTLGLTEAWVRKSDDTVYPTCPGTIAGTFDPELYAFKNFNAQEVYADLKKVYLFLKKKNPAMKFLFTVSPVPLTATASNVHVLSATTYSKSVLRAVAGQMYQEHKDVDYFPSYEIIMSPWSRGFYFEPNLRSVSTSGVDAVMSIFFGEHGTLKAAKTSVSRKIADRKKEEDLICEDALLEAFSK